MHFAALIGAIGGFLASQMPVIWKIVQDWLAYGRRDQFSNRADGQERLESKLGEIAGQLERQNEAFERVSLQALQDSSVTASSFIEWLQASVRPLMTYAFFLLFAVVILVSLYHGLVVEHLPVSTVLPLVWDDDTDTLFAAVISFWFGSRAEAKAYARTQPPSQDPKGTGLNGQKIVEE